MKNYLFFTSIILLCSFFWEGKASAQNKYTLTSNNLNVSDSSYYTQAYYALSKIKDSVDFLNECSNFYISPTLHEFFFDRLVLYPYKRKTYSPNEAEDFTLYLGDTASYSYSSANFFISLFEHQFNLHTNYQGVNITSFFQDKNVFFKEEKANKYKKCTSVVYFSKVQSGIMSASIGSAILVLFTFDKKKRLNRVYISPYPQE